MKKNTIPKLHVLLIDDDNNHLLLLKDQFEKNNKLYKLKVSTANHIGEISSDDLNTVNIAVIDLFMPELDGITTSLILKSKIKIPIVILTGNPEDERLEEFEGLLEPIMPIEKTTNYQGMCNSVYSFYKTGRDFIGLTEKINNQELIHLATGIIMNQNKCNEVDAMKTLKHSARSQEIKMSVAAQKILDVNFVKS